jgi:hypothetical protein
MYQVFEDIVGILTACNFISFDTIYYILLLNVTDVLPTYYIQTRFIQCKNICTISVFPLRGFNKRHIIFGAVEEVVEIHLLIALIQCKFYPANHIEAKVDTV